MGRGSSSRLAASMAETVVVVETGADHEIRKSHVRLGGLGRAFLRSRDILQLLYLQRQAEFEEQVTPVPVVPRTASICARARSCSDVRALTR